MSKKKKLKNLINESAQSNFLSNNQMNNYQMAQNQAMLEYGEMMRQYNQQVLGMQFRRMIEMSRINFLQPLTVQPQILMQQPTPYQVFYPNFVNYPLPKQNSNVKQTAKPKINLDQSEFNTEIKPNQ
ncbi:hypothetical protein [Spiroplasma endosymbiont of Labia minor]|uniref:hypothetical protein n=1 Tax=Spiroplasma endosymbiont of Labia minor TaxID=3066305 RepID=UPI0030CBAC12